MERSVLPSIAAATAIFILAVPGTAQEIGPAKGISRAEAGVCAEAIAYTEDAWRLPDYLLHAVALAESGRWTGRGEERIAWPWTVTAGGEGRFFPTKQAAIAHVRRLQARGVRNIDVGCMQVNLSYHPDAFRTLDQAFDPAANASYAAAYLDSLRHETRSIARAVAHYHSSERRRGRRYWKRVRKIWIDERQRAYARARAERIAAFRRMKAARAANRGKFSTAVSVRRSRP